MLFLPSLEFNGFEGSRHVYPGGHPRLIELASCVGTIVIVITVAIINAITTVVFLLACAKFI
jgi:hypothetical protein